MFKQHNEIKSSYQESGSIKHETLRAKAWERKCSPNHFSWKVKDPTEIIKEPTESSNVKEKSKYLQNLHGGPLYFAKSRGFVGVPTNGDMLGEPVISVCLPED